MNFFTRIALLALSTVILSLNVGIDVYRVHCSMRDQTFVSLLTAYDPCVENEVEEQASCCKAKAHCSNEIQEHEEDPCCDEEQITITYEPDFFQKTHVQAYLTPWQLIEAPDFSFSSAQVCPHKESIKEYPQPPPLSGRDILTYHAVLRI
jgi:hypothetical protein